MAVKILIKLKSALYSTLILGFLFFLFEIVMGDFSVFFLVAIIYAGIGNFLYGIPVSLFSDFLTKWVSRYRFIVASFIHILFAFLTTLIIGELGVYAVISSLLFFLVDEWQRRKIQPQTIDKRNVLVKGLVTMLLFSLGIVGSIKLAPELEEKTHDYYIIPEGYVGEVSVVYNIKHAPPPKKIGEYNVININNKGYGITQLPESEGIIENKYFYIDIEGNKEEIDQDCINIGGSHSTSGDGYEYSSSHFTVTDHGCGNEFIIEGNPTLPEGLSLEEILLEESLAEMKNYRIEPKKNKTK